MSPSQDREENRLGRKELDSEVENVPEPMQPRGEPGLVGEAQEETKRIDDDVEPDEDPPAGEDEGDDDAVEHDTGAQS